MKDVICFKFSILYSLLLLTILSTTLYGQDITEKETTTILTALADDANAGRKPGTAGYDQASAYVVEYFTKNGIEPFFGDNYYDTVVYDSNISYNVVGVLNNATASDGYILIGAHLDHIGTSGTPSADGANDNIYNGANDNATGCTAVLQIARYLSEKKIDANVMFVLFTEEESGLNGSRHLARKLRDQRTKIDYVINFEMIGTILTSGRGRVYITGYDKSDFPLLLNEALGETFAEFLPEATQFRLFERSDNYPFYQTMGIPAHTLSTFDFKNFAYYHKQGDEVDKLNIPNMNVVINKAARAIESLISSGTPPKLILPSKEQEEKKEEIRESRANEEVKKI